MFGLGKKRKPSPGIASTSLQLRDTLFGDMPWETWAKDSQSAPGTYFAEAYKEHKAGRNAPAITALRNILAMPHLESRQYLQAWHFLRSLGVTPPADAARHVFGVVIEVGMDKGLDILAVYEDQSARYWNFSGAGVVWEPADDPTINQAITDVLRRAKTVIDQIGPWKEPRPSAPTTNMVRLNILAPAGLHFGQAPTATMARDPLGGPLFMAGAQLMEALTTTALAARKKTKTA